MSYKTFKEDVRKSGEMGEQDTFETCNVTGKRCLTYAQARTHLNLYKSHHVKMHGKKIPKREYRCEFCGCYHLTSTIKRNRKNLYQKADSR